jgi:hypothetical protein
MSTSSWQDRAGQDTNILRTLENHTVRQIVVKVSRLQKLVKRGEEFDNTTMFFTPRFSARKKDTQIKTIALLYPYPRGPHV